MAQLCRRESELTGLGVVVRVISFDAPSETRAWKEDVCPGFEILSDEAHDVYRAYGMGHSLFRSWTPRTVLFYVRALLSGRHWRGIRGDPNQLGGDVIVNPDGTFRLYHPSQSATDRQAVDEMIALLRGE